MTGPQRRLADDDARQAAITGHDRSLLVEAGAGTGKTAMTSPSPSRPMPVPPIASGRGVPPPSGLGKPREFGRHRDDWAATTSRGR